LAGLSLVLCSFGCTLIYCLFGFRKFNKTNLSGNGNGNGNGNGHIGCVSVRYNSLFISLPLFTKRHNKKQREIAYSAYSRKCELFDGQFLKS